MVQRKGDEKEGAILIQREIAKGDIQCLLYFDKLNQGNNTASALFNRFHWNKSGM